jgi:hypothetical protein
MEPSERVVESVLLTEDEYDNLVAAREAMYGDRASEVDLSHVISLLALAETRRCEEREAEEARMFDGTETALPETVNQEYPR